MEAIREVMAGRTYVSPKLVEAMAVALAAGRIDTSRSTRPLSPREREILRRIAGGEGTKEIAVALGLGTKTVETHRRRLMNKLDMHTVAELTKYAVIHGITPLDGVSQP